MLIKVQSKSPVEHKPGKGGGYDFFTLTYTSGGKSLTRKMVSFTAPEVYNTIQAADAGDSFDVTVTKEGEYSNWTGIKVASAKEAAAATASATEADGKVRKTTYETPEERAAKQEYIVRQSSITNAIEFYNVRDSSDFDENDVLELAMKFRDFVFATQEADVPLTPEVPRVE